MKLGSGKKIDQKAISNLDFIEVLLQSSSENDKKRHLIKFKKCIVRHMSNWTFYALKY